MIDEALSCRIDSVQKIKESGIRNSEIGERGAGEGRKRGTGEKRAIDIVW